MPPAKRTKAVTPEHPGDACEAPRTERFDAPSSAGSVRVFRCQECGAQETE